METLGDGTENITVLETQTITVKYQPNNTNPPGPARYMYKIEGKVCIME